MIIPSEHIEQSSLIAWVDLAKYRIPELGLLFAIPNGGKRDIRTAVKLKREGVRAGIPDLFLPVARSTFYGLFIEMKSMKGSPTPEQVQMMQLLREQGYMCIVCRGWLSAKEAIEQYLAGEAI